MKEESALDRPGGSSEHHRGAFGCCIARQQSSPWRGEYPSPVGRSSGLGVSSASPSYVSPNTSSLASWFA